MNDLLHSFTCSLAWSTSCSSFSSVLQNERPASVSERLNKKLVGWKSGLCGSHKPSTISQSPKYSFSMYIITPAVCVIVTSCWKTILHSSSSNKAINRCINPWYCSDLMVCSKNRGLITRFHIKAYHAFLFWMQTAFSKLVWICSGPKTIILRIYMTQSMYPRFIGEKHFIENACILHV